MKRFIGTACLALTLLGCDEGHPPLAVCPGPKPSSHEVISGSVTIHLGPLGSPVEVLLADGARFRKEVPDGGTVVFADPSIQGPQRITVVEKVLECGSVVTRAFTVESIDRAEVFLPPELTLSSRRRPRPVPSWLTARVVGADSQGVSMVPVGRDIAFHSPDLRPDGDFEFDVDFHLGSGSALCGGPVTVFADQRLGNGRRLGFSSHLEVDDSSVHAEVALDGEVSHEVHVTFENTDAYRDFYEANASLLVGEVGYDLGRHRLIGAPFVLPVVGPGGKWDHVKWELRARAGSLTAEGNGLAMARMLLTPGERMATARMLSPAVVHSPPLSSFGPDILNCRLEDWGLEDRRPRVDASDISLGWSSDPSTSMHLLFLHVRGELSWTVLLPGGTRTFTPSWPSITGSDALPRGDLFVMLGSLELAEDFDTFLGTDQSAPGSRYWSGLYFEASPHVAIGKIARSTTWYGHAVLE